MSTIKILAILFLSNAQGDDLWQSTHNSGKGKLERIELNEKRFLEMGQNFKQLRKEITTLKQKIEKLENALKSNQK